MTDAVEVDVPGLQAAAGMVDSAANIVEWHVNSLAAQIDGYHLPEDDASVQRFLDGTGGNGYKHSSPTLVASGHALVAALRNVADLQRKAATLLQSQDDASGDAIRKL